MTVVARSTGWKTARERYDFRRRGWQRIISGTGRFRPEARGERLVALRMTGKGGCSCR